MTQKNTGSFEDRAAEICGHLRHLWMIVQPSLAFVLSAFRAFVISFSVAKVRFRNGGFLMTRTNASECHPLRNQRGQGLALLGIGLGTTVFLALAVVAVDVGRLGFTATEVQTVAEATAVTAAKALLDGDNYTTFANTVAGDNRVDGLGAVVPCSGGGTPCADLTLGTIDPSTWAFTAGGAPPNAVRSDAQATVSNILATMLGSPTSTVTKTAVGAFVGLGSGTPTLPLTVCSECFPSGGCLVDNCISLTGAPTGSNTAAWTGFLGGTGTSDIAAFMPAPCGTGSSTIPPLSSGDSINLNNGQQSQTQLINPIQCMTCPPNNITSFLIPVIQCGSCGAAINQVATVVGFTTVVIESFNYSNQGSTPNLCGPSQGALKSMNLHEIRNTDVTGPPGGGLFGTLVVGMVG